MTRKPLCLLLPALLAACAARVTPPGTSTAPAVATRPTKHAAHPPRFGPLSLLSAWHLRCDDGRFGGLSGLRVDPDHDRLMAISDRGHWIGAQLAFAPDGRLTALRDWRLSPLLAPDGSPVDGKGADAEALSRDGDGNWLVAFEQRHRIWRYPATRPFDSPATLVEPAPSLADAPPNGGLESLVSLADGRLLAISERLFTRQGSAVRGWIVGPRGVQPLDYAISALFLPTDAARLPSGDIVVVERRYLGRRRLAARLRVVPAAAIKAGGLLQPRQLARLAPPIPLDNYEGLAVLRRHGQLQLFVVSDDNFDDAQQTLLLQFRFDPDRAQSAAEQPAVKEIEATEIDACPRP